MTIKNNPEYIYKVKNVVRVIDGDTYVLELILDDKAVDYGFGFIDSADLTITKTFRLKDYDTPEIYRSSGKEKELGELAKQFVMSELASAVKISAKSFKNKQGKYGRYLVEVLYEKINGVALNLGKELEREGLLKVKP